MSDSTVAVLLLGRGEMHSSDILILSQPSNPTTTLQALVNLKLPTLRLSPLVSSLQDDDPATDQHPHLHGLEFTYDCDALNAVSTSTSI